MFVAIELPVIEYVQYLKKFISSHSRFAEPLNSSIYACIKSGLSGIRTDLLPAGEVCQKMECQFSDKPRIQICRNYFVQRMEAAVLILK
jgi:hypothetical protein